MNAVTNKKPRLRKTLLKLAIASAVLVLSACSKDSSSDSESPDDGDTGGGSGGGATPPPAATGLLTLTAANFEGEAKFIGPRIHTIVGEVYRNLFYIHHSVDINARMIGASSTPSDDVIRATDLLITLESLGAGNGDLTSGFEFCTNTAGINTVFDDDNAPAGFDDGDMMVRDYDNVGCAYNFVDPADLDASIFVPADSAPRWLPANVTGSILYAFTGGNPAAGTYTGTATLGDPESGLNYEVVNGLLQATEASEEDAFSGTVDFDIDFSTGEATFSNILVTITGGSSGLPGPNTIDIEEIQRTLGATDTISITNGSIVSTNGLALNFRTIPFNNNAADELSGPSGALPNRGAIIFEGDGSAAHARTVINGGIGSIGLELDYDATAPLDPVANPTTVNQFDDSAQAEPGGSAFFVSDFLMTEGYTVP